ncbi:protein of unknown function [Nitrospina watsonii]|uniref:Uncharacterized protein n=1 Tax=Nitrospina watsonii TaxID=1323948 RepID=A0ABN8W3C2_9BACT|nr:protein of unknown function [Nitrospina watsonii]
MAPERQAEKALKQLMIVQNNYLGTE